MKFKINNKTLALILALLLKPSQSDAIKLLELENIIKQGAPLTTTLSAHPLYPYLEYQAFKQDLYNIDQEQIINFLNAHPRAPFSTWLAQEIYPIWLQQNKPQAILKSYHESFANQAIECNWRVALLRTGKTQKAKENLEQLWDNAGDISSHCEPLFDAFPPSQTQLLNRFIKIMQQGETNIAHHLLPHMIESARQDGRIWLEIREKKRPINDIILIQNPNWQIYALDDLLNRMTREELQKNIDFAIQIIRTHPSPKGAGKGFMRSSARLAQNDDQRAEQLFKATSAGTQEKNHLLDLIAYYQRNQKWQEIPTLWQALDETQQNDPEILYWLGKAYEKQGKHKKSQSAYQKAATQRDFFGFLAAEKLKLPLQFNDQSPLPNNDYHLLKNSNNRYRIQTFKNLRANTRMQQEINALTNRQSLEELRQSALMLSEMGLHTQAIFALARGKDWDALQLRFPILYRELIEIHSKNVNLSPATTLAIIRQESIFQENIRSSAGAIGLMQIMPRTAQAVAKKYNIPYQNQQSLTNPNTNIQIGTHYLSEQIQNYGHLAYAAAAYNAGPSRVNRWLEKNPDLPLDEWIAQIPFYETRTYVKRVLEYQKIYEYLLKQPITPYYQEIRAW